MDYTWKTEWNAPIPVVLFVHMYTFSPFLKVWENWDELGVW